MENSLLQDTAELVDEALTLLRRGSLTALAASSVVGIAGAGCALVLAGLSAISPYLLLLWIPFAVLAPLSTYGAAVAAFTLALDHPPRVREAVNAAISWTTLRLIWTLPMAGSAAILIGVFGEVVASGPPLLRVFAVTILIVTIEGSAVLVARIIMTAVVGYTGRSIPDTSRHVDDLVGDRIVLPSLVVLAPTGVLAAAVGGWFSPIVSAGPVVLTLVTSVAAFAAAALLAVLPAALYGVLRRS